VHEAQQHRSGTISWFFPLRDCILSGKHTRIEGWPVALSSNRDVQNNPLVLTKSKDKRPPKRKRPLALANGLYLCRRRPTLPHTFACSTIGPAGLDFRVRDGNGYFPRGKITGFAGVCALVCAAWSLGVVPRRTWLRRTCKEHFALRPGLKPLSMERAGLHARLKACSTRSLHLIVREPNSGFTQKLSYALSDRLRAISHN
jgi:hypothetical protein